MLNPVRFAALIAFTLAPLASGAAQAVPNLTGTWVMAADKSDFGQLPAPTGRSDVIDHREPALSVKRMIQSPEGPVTLELKYTIDGKPYTNTSPQGDIVSTLKWEGATLVVNSKVPTPNGDAAIIDRYTVSADGKTMTQDRTISIQGQELKQTIVLVKS